MTIRSVPGPQLAPHYSVGMGVTDTDEQLIDVHAHFLTDAYVIAARALNDPMPRQRGPAFPSGMTSGAGSRSTGKEGQFTSSSGTAVRRRNHELGQHFTTR